MTNWGKKSLQSLVIEPAPLKGRISAQPSKSMAHRLVICAFLSRGLSVIDNVVLSDDIRATIGACEALGAEISIEDSIRFERRKRVIVKSTGKVRADKPEINCHESGSTARFMIPVSRLCEEKVSFTGSGRLAARPFEIFKDLLPAKGVVYSDNDGKMPICLSGRLTGGEYRVKGDVSSQFISGLLFALPRLEGDSVIKIEGRLESRGYIEMTLDALKSFGIDISHDDDMNVFHIRGGQTYLPGDFEVEGDWSQAAFFCVLGAISGTVRIDGLRMDSLQGDKIIIDFIRKIGADIRAEGASIMISPSKLNAVDVDASQCPDLVPAMAVALALSKGRSLIYNAARLRLKESDRLHATCVELNRLGARVEERQDGLVINGADRFTGGTTDDWNDHRIVMALAIASSACARPVEINGFSAVSKSYPEFWDDLRMLGGIFHEQHLG